MHLLNLRFENSPFHKSPTNYSRQFSIPYQNTINAIARIYLNRGRVSQELPVLSFSKKPARVFFSIRNSKGYLLKVKGLVSRE